MTLKSRTRVLRVLPLMVLIAASAGFATVHASAAMAAQPNPVLYNSIPNPLPGNLPSVGFQANQTSEFGNAITLVRPNAPKRLKQFTVTLSSWACQAGSATDGTCVSTKGSTFSEPVTLNLYNASPDDINPGSLIATQTQTFNIPYRPTARPQCGNGGWGAQCNHGKATNIVFKFGAPNVVLPQSLVYGIAYSTSDYGPAPYGDQQACNTAGPGGSDGCPYDSLNVALSQDPTNVSVGSDTYQGNVFWNTSTPANYCDGGNDGVGTFRRDSPGFPDCWSVSGSGAPYYVPSVKIIES
jgi:hypothetical protein